MFSQSYQQSPAPPPANQTTAVVQMPVQSPIPAPAQAIPTQQQQHRMSYNQSPQQVILTAPAQPNSDTQPQSQTMPNFPNSSGAIVISTPTPPPSTTPSMAPPNVVISSNAPGTTSGSLSGNSLFDSKRLIELVQEVDPSLQIDEDVEDFLLQLADEFIEQVASKACQLAKHRGSSTLDAKDIQLTLERDWHYYVPGYVSDDVKSTRKSHVTEAHRQRMAIIKQQTGKK